MIILVMPNTALLIVLLNWLCAIVGHFGDAQRARLGQWLVNYLRSRGDKIPTADELVNPDDAEMAEKIQRALDAPGPDGKPGGWNAAMAVVEERRREAWKLLGLPNQLAVTILMGLGGKAVPTSAPAAAKLLFDLMQQYYASAHREYLFNEILAETARRLRAADNDASFIGPGILRAMFNARAVKDKPVGWRAREAMVLLFLKRNAEYRKFLTKNSRNELSLPDGVTFEEFAANMLMNAYGQI